MDVPLAIMSETLAAAGNVNRTGDSRPRRSDESVVIPQIIVFRSAVLRWLVAASVSVMLLCVIELSCQIGIVIQSKRLMTAALGAILFVWTMILMLLNAKWIIILSRNRMEIVKKGKNIVGLCQALCFLGLTVSIILLLVENNHAASLTAEFQWSIAIVVACYGYSAAIFFLLFTFILRGQRQVQQIIGSWLWSIIHQQLMRQQMILDDSVGEHVRDYLLANYNPETLCFSAEAA